MKKAILTVFLLGLVACATFVTRPPLPGAWIITAQSLPYTLTVAWDAPADGSATSYTCYLDGVAVKSGVTALTCQLSVAASGSHTVGVTSVNPTFVPSESVPATLTFQLKTPTAPAALKVK